MDDRRNLLAQIAGVQSQRATAGTLREMGQNYLSQMAGDTPAGVAANTIMGFTGPAIVGAAGAAGRGAELTNKAAMLQRQIDELGPQIANAWRDPAFQRQLMQTADALRQESANVSRQQGLRIAPGSRYANPNLDR